MNPPQMSPPNRRAHAKRAPCGHFSPMLAGCRAPRTTPLPPPQNSAGSATTSRTDSSAISRRHSPADESSLPLRSIAAPSPGAATECAERARVVQPLVRIRQTLKNCVHFAVTVRGPACKLIRDRQSESPQTQHVLRVRRQNIPANRLRFLRLIQISIQLRLRNSLGNPRFRNGFQFQIHTALTSNPNLNLLLSYNQACHPEAIRQG